MLQNLGLRIYLTMRNTGEGGIALTRRMFSKNPKCGNESPKCDSKDKPKPTCKRTRKPRGCKKQPAPYPSYSECKKDPTPAKPPSECDCLKLDK